jgi:putative endonuclease
MSTGPWYLYLIECADGALYTGIALDPAARFEQHRTGKGAKYTRANRPVRLIGVISYPDRSTATRAELAFKRLKAAEKRARLWAFDEIGGCETPRHQSGSGFDLAGE